MLIDASFRAAADGLPGNGKEARANVHASPSRIRQIVTTMAAMMSATTAPRHLARGRGPVIPIVMV